MTSKNVGPTYLVSVEANWQFVLIHITAFWCKLNWFIFLGDFRKDINRIVICLACYIYTTKSSIWTIFRCPYLIVFIILFIIDYLLPISSLVCLARVYHSGDD